MCTSTASSIVALRTSNLMSATFQYVSSTPPSSSFCRFTVPRYFRSPCDLQGTLDKAIFKGPV